MKYEFHAQFPLVLQDSVLQASAISFLVGEKQSPPQPWQKLAQVPDDFARLILLAQAIATGRKDEARVGSGRNAGGLRFWLAQRSEVFLSQRLKMMQNLQMLPSPPDLSALPLGSWILRFTFTLRKPYLSQDDTALHLLDNPVKKEYVFKVPYAAPTQWKGALQATMVRQLVEWWQRLNQAQQAQRTQRKQFVARRIQLTRLFGTESETVRRYLAQCSDDKLDKWYQRYVRRFLSATGFLAGRLYFYPAFFNRLSLEVINPYNRETGAGSQPIYFESVPTGTRGDFTLLYTPLDRTGQDEAETRRQVATDLQLVAAGLQAMFTTYGFGAKTSSGFGVAENAVREGAVVVGGLLYEAETAPQPPPYPLAQETFDSFADLKAQAQKLAEALRQKGGEE